MNGTSGRTAATALAALVLALGTPAGAANGSSARVRLIDLGSLGGGYSQAYAINERGDVVGVSSTPQGDLHPVLWLDGRIIDLGVGGGLGTAARAVNNRGQVVGCVAGGGAFLWQEGQLTTLVGAYCATAINDRGQVVGSRETPAGVWRAFLWERGSMTDLGTLGYLNSAATGINDHGEVIGVLSNSDGTLRRTFIWQQGKMTDLGTLGGPSSTPSGINNRGQVIGTSDVDSAGTLHPFLWESGRLTDLLAGHSAKYAYAFNLNDSGSVVGQVDYRPFLWRRGTLIDLGTAGRGGYASAINDCGHVAGVNAALNTNDDRPFVWRRGHATYLGTLGGPYTSTVGIDTRDRVVGNSSTPAGESHAVVWTTS